MLSKESCFKECCFFLGFACLLLLVAVIPSPAKDTFPRPVGAVNDFAGVIPTDTKAKMEDIGREILSKTGTAVVVTTMPTIGDDEVNDYVNRLYSSWGIGKKGEKKGVLIFLTVKERKMRIETGYGVEGILPDGLVGEIRDKYMIPFLREGNYGKGLMNGMTAIGAVIANDAGVTLTGNPVVERPRAKQPASRLGVSPWTIAIVIVVLIFFLGTGIGRDFLPFLLGFFLGRGGRGGYGGGSGSDGGFGGFGGGFGGFGGGDSGGGGAGGDF